MPTEPIHHHHSLVTVSDPASPFFDWNGRIEGVRFAGEMFCYEVEFPDLPKTYNFPEHFLERLDERSQAAINLTHDLNEKRYHRRF